LNLRLTNRQLFVYGLLVLIIGAAIGSISLTYPFGRDQGIYAYAGKMLLEGKMNYLHVFDLKPPGIHFLFAFAELVFGEKMLNLRIFDILWQAFTAYMVFLIAFKFTLKKNFSVAASFIYLILYFRQDYWHTFQADGMLNLPFAVSILLLLSSNEYHSFLKIFFAGVLFSVALIFKYTIISFFPLVLICFLSASGELRSLRFKNTAVYSAGVITVLSAAAILYYFTGALGEFINIQFVQTPLYTKIAYDTESTSYITSQIVKLFVYSVYTPLIWLSLIAMLASVVKKKLNFRNAVLFSWVLSSLFSLIIQWKFYYYHFLVVLAPLAVCCVYSVSEFLKKAGESRKKTVLAFVSILFIVYSVYSMIPYVQNYSNLAGIAFGEKTLNEVYIKNGFTSDSVFMISKTFNAIENVEKMTDPGDNIFVWGFDPLVYYISGRKCVSRFIYNFPLLWKGENSAMRKEFITAIENDNPKLILVAQNDPLFFISGYNEDSKQLLERFPEFKRFIESKYYFRMKQDDFDYYELGNW
jgi:hypothetical protein